MADLSEELQARLHDSATVRNKTGGRIRPLVIEPEEKLPAIAYSTVDSESWTHLGGASGEAQTRVQFDCYGRTRREANEVADTVIDCLHTFTGTLTTITVVDCVLDNKYDRIDPPAKGSTAWRHRRVIDFLVTHSEATPSLSLS